jgi:heptosyltransferase-3
VLTGNPDVDKIYVYTKLKHRDRGQSAVGILVDRLRLLSRLRRERFDYVVLAKSEFDKHGLALARHLRARHILGFAPNDGRESAITMPIPPPANAELHEVEVMMQLAAALDVHEPPGPLRVFVERELVAQLRSQFPTHEGRKRWVALHISAREPGRLWPVERFVELAGILVRQNFGIILLWAPGGADDPRHPGDDARATAIVNRVGSGQNLMPAKTERLDELIAVLSLCDAFIGADGGAMHVASGLRLPVVAFFENLPAKKRHWHPWQVPYEMVCSETRHIADMPVQQVVEAWNRLAGRLESTRI